MGAYGIIVAQNNAVDGAVCMIVLDGQHTWIRLQGCSNRSVQ